MEHPTDPTPETTASPATVPSPATSGPISANSSSDTAKPADELSGSGLRSIARATQTGEFSILDAMGGWRGLCESVLPTLVFLIAYLVSHQLRPALIGALASAGLLLLARVITRSNPSQVIGGAIAVVIGAIWAARTGQAGDYFVWGFYTNAAYFLALSISAIAGWPAVGVLLSVLTGKDLSWRTPPLRTSGIYRRYSLATWIWAGLFAARLAVQLPLYFAGRIEWLGTARIVMGLPLFALIAYLTWLILRDLRPAANDSATDDLATDTSDAAHDSAAAKRRARE